jgi:hypothetical protein
MDNSNGTANNTMQIIQSANNHSTFFLTEHGFHSDSLNASSKKIKNKQ